MWKERGRGEGGGRGERRDRFFIGLFNTEAEGDYRKLETGDRERKKGEKKKKKGRGKEKQFSILKFFFSTHTKLGEGKKKRTKGERKG